MSTPSKDSSHHCSVNNKGKDQDVSFNTYVDVHTRRIGKNAVYKYKRLKNWYFKICEVNFGYGQNLDSGLDYGLVYGFDWRVDIVVLALLDCPMNRGLA